MAIISITNHVQLDEKDIEYQFTGASGPGGQHVNRTASAVQLRFHLNRANIPAKVKSRLKSIAGNRINAEGILIIEAQEHRSQYKNRQSALDRLLQLLREAAHPPKKRIPTKPTKASQERRIRKKKKRGEKKKRRRPIRRQDLDLS